MKKFLLVSMILMFVSLISFGQSGTTGAIKGIVKSSDGEVLPGILVTLTSPSIVVKKMTSISNESGLYRFIGLPPGVYKLTYELEGMNVVVRNGIKINIGATSRINVEMSLKTIHENIEVKGQAPTIDTQTTTKSANMDLNFLEMVPALRTLSSYFNFTPGVTSRSAHGGSVRDTSYNLDGLNLSDPVVGTQGVFFGLDIMEEISVSTGGLSAEYGQTRGATLNVVSKSGGNEFSGTASAYYRHESLQSDNTKGTPLEGETSGYKYELEPGVTLGGPIVKDKLWFFGNISWNQREQFVSGFPYDKETEVPSDDKRPYPYLKLTFQPDQKNKFTVSFNYSDILRANRGASRYDTEATTFKQSSPTYVGNFQWMRQFSSNMYMNLKVGGYYSLFDMERKNDTAKLYSYDTGRDSGSAGYSDFNARHKIQANLDTTIFIDNLAGSHEIKLGGEYMYVWEGRKMTRAGEEDGHGFYNYQNYEYNGLPYRSYWRALVDQKSGMMNAALFINDTWNISSALTLNLGLRFEHQVGIIPEQGAYPEVGDFGFIGYSNYSWDRNVSSSESVMTWSNFAPRASIIYDLFSDGKTLIKASYARYNAGNLTQYFSGLNPNGFITYGYRLNADGSNAYVNTINLPTANVLGWKDHKVSAPYMDELTVGFERELFDDWSISMRYIKKWDRNLLEDVAVTNLDMDALMDDGEFNWTNYTQVTTTDPYDGSTVTFWNEIDSLSPTDYVLVNPPGAKRDYDGVEVVVNKRYSNGWQLNASYVYGKSRGTVGTSFSESTSITSLYDNPNAHINADGRFDYERRHQLKLTGVLRGPWGINLGTYFRYLSGQRYTRKIRSLDVGLDLNQGNTTIYAEKRGSQELPALMTLDLKIEKSIKLGSINVRAFVDIFNVLNNNKASDVYDISGHSTLIYQEMTSIQSPRIFRFGAKVEF